MLRPLVTTLAFVTAFGGFVTIASHQVLRAQARVVGAERDIAALRTELDELRDRVDAPLPPPARPGQVEPGRVYAVPVGDAPSRGPTDAWVTIVEFADYQCPFCGRVESTLAQVRERYGDDVRVVFQHQPLPFHTRAMEAAVAVECAGEQGLLWQMHDTLFARQNELRDGVPALADGVTGLEWGRFATCTEGEAARTRVSEDQRVAERFGARGTPSFFVNGKSLVGAQPLDAFVRAIDAALVEAKASGIPRSEYYRRAVLEKGAPGV